MREITAKIVSYHLDSSDVKIEQMQENRNREPVLNGSTYKLKPVGADNALYVTINDIILNEGTEFEERRPFEMFINSRDVDHFQWVTALTRVISAVFRKGGDFSFLVEELGSIFDPKGGYWDNVNGKTKYIPSIIAGIGNILDIHLNRQVKTSEVIEVPVVAAKESDALKNATLCSKCNTKSVVLMDGCPTCLECGDSKCG